MKKVSDDRWSPDHDGEWDLFLIAFVFICVAVMVVL